MNKVIVFGGDHYNALGLARVFGINGVKPFGVLIADQGHEKDLYASKSKYWEHCWIVKNEEQGLEILKHNFWDEKEKPVLIPSSDGAEELLDCNMYALAERYILPGILNEQGRVCSLMNKAAQVKWANRLGMKTAETWEIELDNLESNGQKVQKFPCILKPVLSSEGEKADIVKCIDFDDLCKHLTKLKEKGYRRILAQEYLIKDYEMELFGCITMNSKTTPFLLSKHVREWPPVGGSVSCHEFIVDESYKAQAQEILNKIKDYGYVGNIDIELFLISGEFYLNEVNFRNSGDVYACFENRVFYPYIWYLDAIGKETQHLNTHYANCKYAMNETTDLRHVIYGKMKLFNWLPFYRNCGDFALKFPGDMKPARVRYAYYLSQFFKRK